MPTDAFSPNDTRASGRHDFFNVLVGVKFWSMLVQSCCNYFGPGWAAYTENLTHILIIRCVEFSTLFCFRFHYSSAVFLVVKGIRHWLRTRLNTKLWYFPWIVVYLSWVDGLVLISNQKNLHDLLMTEVPDSIMKSVSHRVPTVMPKLVNIFSRYMRLRNWLTNVIILAKIMPTYRPYNTIYFSVYSAGSFQVTSNLSNNPEYISSLT